MTAKSRTITYWVTTAILAFVLLSGGMAGLLRMSTHVEGVVHLGYPAYFVGLLGLWKLLGGITVLAPRLPRLKEWAYAGAIFDLSAAMWSHIATGDATRFVVAPLVVAAIAMASWALRPASRALRQPFGARE